MSEQSPWGTPPPSNPYGPPQPQQPQQPSYPQQPPYQTGPGGGGWGGGGGPTYGSPYGGPPSQPPKRRIGLILGIVAAVVVVIAAFTVTFIVASGDDDDPGSASSSDATDSGSPESTETTESESPEPTESPTEPSTDPSTESTAPDEDIETVTGDGYVVALPADGWTDQTAEASGLQGSETIDLVLVLGESIELAQSNIIVEALSAGAATSVEDLESLWKRNLAGTDGATTKDIADRTIGEERAIGVEINGRQNAVGEPIKQVAYLMIHEGKQYSIGLSYPATGDTVSQSDFEIFLASWTWTS